MANKESGGNFITRPLRRGAEIAINVSQAVDAGLVGGGLIIGRTDLVLLGILGFGAGIVGKRLIREKPQGKQIAKMNELRADKIHYIPHAKAA